MTEKQAIDKVVEIANSQVGYREGENNYNKYAAELDPLKLTYGNKQNLAWCGEFVLWVFYKAFGAENGLKVLCSTKPTGIPLCKSGAQYFKDAGRWTKQPAVGDVIFFIVNNDINHTGIVTGVSGLSVTTVEGNSSDMVSRRTYAINDTKIAGYGIPLWSVVADSGEVVVEEPLTLPTLKNGDKGECVRAAQILLRGRDCSVGIWGADGDFGPGTEGGVLAYQRRNGLPATGIITEPVWAKLLGV